MELNTRIYLFISSSTVQMEDTGTSNGCQIDVISIFVTKNEH